MSTKRLTRTVVEGGRRGWNKWERRWSHRTERARIREWLSAVGQDCGLAEARAVPKRDKVYKGFDDKLGAAERWLASRAGQPWRDVEAEVLRTFDTRSLMGRHLVFDHLLPRAWWGNPLRDGWSVNRRLVFRVDDGGRLRAEPPARRRRPRMWGTPGPSAAAKAFVGDRVVGVRGDRLYWMEGASETDGVLRRRQGRALSAKERETWGSLTETDRSVLVVELPQ